MQEEKKTYGPFAADTNDDVPIRKMEMFTASARPCSHVHVSGRTEYRGASGKHTKGSDSGDGGSVRFRRTLLRRSPQVVEALGEGAHVPFV